MRDLVNALILLGALQGAVLAPILWARRANHLANRILATLVGGVALMMLLVDLEHRFGFDGHPHLLALGQPLPFLFGPLLYLYAIALTRPVVRIDPRWLAHALPFAADVLFMAQVFFLKSGDDKLALARATHLGLAPISLHVVNALEVVQALVYLFLTWQALEHYERKMKGYFSDLAKVDLRWLRALVLTHAAVWSVVSLSIVLRWASSTPSASSASTALGFVIQLGSSCVIFLTGYVSLWQPELVQKATAARAAEEEAPITEAPPPKALAEPPPAPALITPPAPIAVVAPEPQAPEHPLSRPGEAEENVPGSGRGASHSKYQRNRLDEAEAQALVTKLEALMIDKQLYREPGLTLAMLADELGVTPHMVSQVLNVRVGKSFFVYVNTFRADALKEALADPSRSERGVLELAFEVGFSSKSTLNSAFKKHTGLTPTEFRARAQATKAREKSVA